MERDKVIIFRVPAAVRESLQRHAASQTRTLSNMTLHIVTEWLAAQGDAPAPVSPRKPKASDSSKGR